MTSLLKMEVLLPINPSRMGSSPLCVMEVVVFDDPEALTPVLTPTFPHLTASEDPIQAPNTSLHRNFGRCWKIIRTLNFAVCLSEVLNAE